MGSVAATWALCLMKESYSGHKRNHIKHKTICKSFRRCFELFADFGAYTNFSGTQPHLKHREPVLVHTFSQCIMQSLWERNKFEFKGPSWESFLLNLNLMNEKLKLSYFETLIRNVAREKMKKIVKCNNGKSVSARVKSSQCLEEFGGRDYKFERHKLNCVFGYVSTEPSPRGNEEK